MVALIWYIDEARLNIQDMGRGSGTWRVAVAVAVAVSLLQIRDAKTSMRFRDTRVLGHAETCRRG